MKSWAKEMNRRVKAYDSCLFVQEGPNGRYDLYRSSKFGTSPPHLIFSLTDTWQPTGRPVDYGIDTVLNRLKAHDLWRDDLFVERYIEQQKKDADSRERARDNSIESFLLDFRRQFARATDSINTANLNKIYKEDTHGHR